LAGRPSVRRKPIQLRFNHDHRARKGGLKAANAEGNGERPWLYDEDLTDGYYFVRCFLGKISVSQGESDPTAPQSTPPDLGAVISSTKMRNGDRRLPTPPPPGTTPSDPLLPPDDPPLQAPQRRAGGTARNDSGLEPNDTMNPGMNYIYNIQPCPVN